MGNFDPASFDQDIYVRVVRGLGQGNGFAEVGGGLSVGVDTVISASLRDEGLVRDIIRRIQNQRKEAGFNIADSIETYYRAGPKLVRLLEDHKKLICAETLSKTLTDAELPADAHVQTYEIGGEKLELGLMRT